MGCWGVCRCLGPGLGALESLMPFWRCLVFCPALRSLALFGLYLLCCHWGWGCPALLVSSGWGGSALLVFWHSLHVRCLCRHGLAFVLACFHFSLHVSLSVCFRFLSLSRYLSLVPCCQGLLRFFSSQRRRLNTFCGCPLCSESLQPQACQCVSLGALRSAT